MKLKGNRNELRCATVVFVVVDDESSDVVILLCHQSTVKVEGTMMMVRGVVVVVESELLKLPGIFLKLDQWKTHSFRSLLS